MTGRRAGDTPPRWARLLMDAMSTALQRMGSHRFVLADLIGWLIAVSRPGRLRDVAERHARANPGIDSGRARALAIRSFIEYSRTNLDFLWSHHMDGPRVRAAATVNRLDRLRASRREHGGGILVLAHHGSWDFAAAVALAHDIPLSTVMRPMHGRLFQEVAVWARRARGLEVFVVGRRAAAGLVDAVRHGRFDAVLVDIPEGGGTVEVRFRGGPVRFSTAPAHLARKTGTPVHPVACYRTAGGRYVAEIGAALQPGDEPEADFMQRVADALESLISRAPEQWYPFNPVYTDEMPESVMPAPETVTTTAPPAHARR